MTTDSDASASFRPASADAPDHRVVLFVAWVAMAIPFMVVGWLLAAVLPSVPWWVGPIVGAVVAAGIIALRLRGTHERLLGAMNAVPADPVEHARLFNLVQGLSLAGGISEPDLYLVADEARNAAAMAQRDRSAIVFTTGLLDAVDRIGLEGIVAEALVRIISGDAQAAVRGSALFGPLLAGPLASLARPLTAFGLRRLLIADRDLAADRAAVALTRYPPGLLTALDSIRAGSPAVSGANRASDHLWLVPPTALEGSTGSVLAVAPLDLRIDVLGEL